MEKLRALGLNRHEALALLPPVNPDYIAAIILTQQGHDVQVHLHRGPLRNRLPVLVDV